MTLWEGRKNKFVKISKLRKTKKQPEKIAIFFQSKTQKILMTTTLLFITIVKQRLKMLKKLLIMITCL